MSILNKRRAKQCLYDHNANCVRDKEAATVCQEVRTEKVMSYQGGQRAFIFCFLNAGTQAHSRHTQWWTVAIVVPSAPATSLNSSHRYMQQAAEQLTSLIDELIKKEIA